MHAVVALELGIGRQRGRGRPAVRGIVRVEIVGLVIQREEEKIGSCLARAVHVGDAIGPEALREIVETAGLGGVNLRQCRGNAIRRKSLLVEVDGHMRNQRLPLRLDEHLRVVKRTRGGINDMALNSAVLAGGIGLFTEFEEIVLAREALPALDSDPRRIDAAGGTAWAAGTAHYRSSRYGGTYAVRCGAIDRARYAKVHGHRDLFAGVGQILVSGGRTARRVAGRAARRCSVGGTARVVDHVGSGVLVTGNIRFYDIPTEQRERFVEIGGAGEVGAESVLQAAVAQPDGDGNQRNSRTG